MHKAMKKVYISILTICLVFVTVIATTYAWVGILTYSSTSEFELNVKTNKLDTEYYLTISSSGNDNDFSNNTNPIDLKKQIIKNMGLGDHTTSTDNEVENVFAYSARLTPVTSESKSSICKDEFYALNNMNQSELSEFKSSSFFKFDIYLSVEHKSGDEAIQGVTKYVDTIISDIENTIEGNLVTNNITNGLTYPAAINPLDNYGFSGVSAGQSVTINSSSAARIALAIYEPILRSDSYDSSAKPKLCYVYEGGTQNPSYDTATGVYSFGGVLPEDRNVALKEYKTIHKLRDYHMVPSDALLKRGDEELVQANRQLTVSNKYDSLGQLDPKYVEFGIENGKKMKMKITCYFWYEGYDSDCFEIIDGVDCKLKLSFATGNELNS